MSSAPAAEALTLSQLPLFPLQSVLFPGGWLPLRIFEVRYLDMIGRCHKAGAPFGVVCLSEGSEVRRPDPKAPPGGDGFAKEDFHPIGVLARIESLEKPQPGLYMIRCQGLHRLAPFRRGGEAHGKDQERGRKARHGAAIFRNASRAGYKKSYSFRRPATMGTKSGSSAAESWSSARA